LLISADFFEDNGKVVRQLCLDNLHNVG